MSSENAPSGIRTRVPSRTESMLEQEEREAPVLSTPSTGPTGEAAGEGNDPARGASDFEARVNIGGHAEIIVQNDEVWLADWLGGYIHHEPLDQAIPKLAFILAAARIAANEKNV